MSDWEIYKPESFWTENTNYKSQYRRIGNHIEFTIKYPLKYRIKQFLKRLWSKCGWKQTN